ncbi:MAG TPA: hypothetical protein PKX93_10880, partial [bacterium]|nr:hypothetical protein [bacterium]
GGFTLIEVLVTSLIVFLLFVLIYQTYFTSQKVTAAVNSQMDQAETAFMFFQQFYHDVENIVPDIKSLQARADYLQMQVNLAGTPYPVKRTYAFKPGVQGLELWLGESSPLFDRQFAFPALEGIEDGAFSYYDGSDWYQAWDKDKMPEAILLKLTLNGVELSLPVKISHE